MAVVAGGRIAVVLFNLGGPDAPEAVQPFLFNLFNDPAIIALPQPLRWALATVVSHRRTTVAQEIYSHIGGASPLLEETRRQADALGDALTDLGSDGGDIGIFIAMRYWHPMSEETALEVSAFAPDRIVLLPLYPQFSTTTTASSLAAWRREAVKCGLDAPTTSYCCYPAEHGLVAAHAAGIGAGLDEAARGGRPRLLFSAHGLPKKIVDKGDPYVWQVERSAAAVARALAPDYPDLDWTVCYQSRVGPLEWVGPSTDEELARAGADGVPVVVAPIAFVSEHSETLVELDIEYRKLAGERGVPAYVRVPALGAAAPFIDGLAGLVRRAVTDPPGQGSAVLCSQEGGRICPRGLAGCPQGSGG